MTTDDLTFPLRRSLDLLKADPVTAKQAFGAAARASAPVCPSCNKPVRHRAGLEWCQDHQMSEATLQNRVVDRAKRRGWVVAHAGKGIAAFDAEGNPVFVTPMRKGWPDLFMLRERDGRVLVIELKREDNDLDPEQLEYLQLFNRCGIPAIMVKPSDLREGRVNAVLK